MLILLNFRFETPICLTVRRERATISVIAKNVRYFKLRVLGAWTTSMAAGPQQADDMDYMLRDALSEIASAAPRSPRLWNALSGQIERARRPVASARCSCRRPAIAARVDVWIWHLLSLVVNHSGFDGEVWRG